MIAFKNNLINVNTVEFVREYLGHGLQRTVKIWFVSGISETFESGSNGITDSDIDNLLKELNDKS